MTATFWKTVGVSILAAALQALVQALTAHVVDPNTASAAGALAGGAYLIQSPLKK